jgi:hypothetical protein
MSTKGTSAHELDGATGVGYHLYEVVFEDGNVYLQLEGFQFEASNILWRRRAAKVAGEIADHKGSEAWTDKRRDRKKAG